MIASTVQRSAGVKIGSETILWLALALGITGVNLLNQASLDFSVLTGLFVVLTYFTVRAAGGVKTMIGAVATYVAFQHVIIACFAKFLYGQPIQDRLDMPVGTMEIYCLGMTSMMVGAFLGSKVLSHRRLVLFEPVDDPGMLTKLAWAAIFLELLQVPLGSLRGSQLASGESTNAGVLSVFLGMQFIGPLAIACATGACVLRSDRRKSLDLFVLFTFLPALALSLYGANRSVASNAVATYFLAAWLFGFRFRLIHFAAIAALGWFAVTILFPYAHYARNEIRGSNISQNIVKAVAIFEDVLMNPSKYQTQEYPTQLDFREARANTSATKHTYFYVPTNDTLSRFATLKLTDELAYNAAKQEPLGWLTILDGIQLATPSVLESEKPLLPDNNMLGHMVPGLLNPKDVVTQPNTGLFADGFISFRWIGVALYPGVALFVYMVIYGFITRPDLTANAYGLGLVLLIAHTYSETSIGQQISLMTFAAVYTVIGLSIIKAIASVLQGRRFLRPQRSVTWPAEAVPAGVEEA